jgi:hypothetical protein
MSRQEVPWGIGLYLLDGPLTIEEHSDPHFFRIVVEPAVSASGVGTVLPDSNNLTQKLPSKSTPAAQRGLTTSVWGNGPCQWAQRMPQLAPSSARGRC